jgi:hypothetical protein
LQRARLIETSGACLVKFIIASGFQLKGKVYICMASQTLQLCTLASWQKRVLSISRESRVIFAFNPFLIFVLLFLKATKLRMNNYEQNVIFDAKVPIYCISANKIKLLHQILETE